MTKPVCVILGAGGGNGAAIARAFAGAGYQIAISARNASALASLAEEIDGATAYSADVTDEAGLRETLAQIASDLGSADVLVYNAGSGSWSSPDETSLESLEMSWRINTAGLLAAAQAVIPAMREKGAGAILVSGAGAAWRGRAMTTAFASAKAAQRSLSQSLARHLGPDGIHVAYVVIDGQIRTPKSIANNPDANEDDYLQPDDIADAYLTLAHQKRSAWTFELDLRPYTENW